MHQHSIFPGTKATELCLPSSGCWVIIEYGPVERADLVAHQVVQLHDVHSQPTVR